MKSFTKKIIIPDPIPLTQAELDKKKLELKKLLITQDEVIKRLQIAREMGDLSENGAYHAAKHELGNTRRQLGKVKHLLKYGFVPTVSNDKKSSEVVAFGRTITLVNNGKEMTFMLVSQFESNPLEKKLSMESPIGKAIIGKKVDDKVTVETPRGEVIYKITQIK
ncbi:MAG: GreA/GreB family elongation factor [Candidatus Pacebacteria bacterium]|nr:GreA/GreB family elongation factor [Candidatus Paceibacterota bacterium]